MDSRIDSWRELLNLKPSGTPAAARGAQRTPEARGAGRADNGASVDSLRLRYTRIRARTLQLAAPLSDEDCGAQSMPDASPVKWHLAHTTWFFETFVLERFERRFAPYNRAFRMLFNSYYDAVGARPLRPERGLLTRPGAAEVRAYRRNVDARILALLKLHDTGAPARDLILLGLHHEQQHQELILTDVKHLLSRNPMRPAYRKPEPDLPAASADVAAAPLLAPLTWVECDGGNVQVGHDGAGFAFDNETPRHVAYLEPYRLASRLVTNAEFLAFVEDGGYRDPRWWLAEGWDWILAQRLAHPLYWHRDADGAWSEFTLGGSVPLDPNLAAVHLSYYEADAYARWADARLPTEAEWEHAAAGFRPQGNLADANRLHPRIACGAGLQQLFGDAWEWTSSSYAPYPGFKPAPGAVGEYNGKFMVNQYVLRGGSCATPADHVRASYRNFFPAHARWQFSGIRLARDAGSSDASPAA